MAEKHTITINGKRYDAHTGLAVKAESASSEATPRLGVNAKEVHQTTERSKTLNRKTVKKPAAAHNGQVRQRGRQMDIMRSPSIQRFAPAQQPSRPEENIAPIVNPVIQRAHNKQKAGKAVAHLAPHEIKQQELSKALAAEKMTPKKQQRSLKQRFPRAFSVTSASLAVLLLAGYMTYLNMPALSIRVAAAQAGIDATYPEYRPGGYRLAGPVSYSEGQVSMRFAANAGPQAFTITEQKSTWNTDAVLENYVKPQLGEDYTTHSQSGLTVYANGGEAAWVNGGILYTIDGNAGLSDSQLLRLVAGL